jgi:hypothetical protein
VKQASLDSIRYTLHRKHQRALEEQLASSSGTLLSVSGSTITHLADTTESRSRGLSVADVDSECCFCKVKDRANDSEETIASSDKSFYSVTSSLPEDASSAAREQKENARRIDALPPSAVVSTPLSSASSGTAFTATTAAKEFIPEVAHRVRDIVLVRVSDQKRVVMESLWNKRVPEEEPRGNATSFEAPTEAKERDASDAASPLNSPSLPVLYRAPSLGDAPDTCAPIVQTAYGQPALVCLFRRWGCCICRMTAASLSSLKPFLDERGIRLIGVGFESIGLKKFVEAGHFGGELYLDPTRSLYKRIECRLTSWKTLWGAASMEVLGLYAQAAKRHYQVDFQGDASQLGAVFLIDANGVTRFLQIQTGDRFQIDTIKILEALGVTPPDDYDPLPDAHKKVW